ncbi:MAG: imidazolonepropionase [Steroidobacteraceae bacterium]
MRFDRIWRHATLATLAPQRAGIGLIENAALAVSQGRIAFAGPMSELPAATRAAEQIDLGGRLVTPGLIDCHTHIVFGGERSAEFELRLAGADYASIARAGGGILSTVRATRAASDETLLSSAAERLEALMREGVTTVEIKSGYGLDVPAELRMLRVARRLGRQLPLGVATTLLAAHALPPDTDRAVYLSEITGELIPRAAAERLADAVDGFCEHIAFTAAEIRAVFQVAREHGLPVKLHADQLSDGGGAALAAEFAALSADHLEWTGEAGVAALARAGTVAVLLPGAFHFLRERRIPPVAALRRAGVPLALATDCNPGTAPLLSILTAMNIGAVQFGLSVQETVAAVTREAARALGRLSEIGTLEVGKRADLAIWNVERPAELVYWLGRNPLHARLWGGA